ARGLGRASEAVSWTQEAERSAAPSRMQSPPLKEDPLKENPAQGESRSRTTGFGRPRLARMAPSPRGIVCRRSCSARTGAPSRVGLFDDRARDRVGGEVLLPAGEPQLGLAAAGDGVLRAVSRTS